MVQTEQVPVEKMPGHWVLARLGKRVLRPGGRELTEELVRALRINPGDAVVEFAPGMGATASRLLREKPSSYIGVERDADAAKQVRAIVAAAGGQVVEGPAQHVPLDDASATVVVGEAMLTMQSDDNKVRIIAEAARLLEVGGRYGIHELCLTPSDIAPALEQKIHDELSRTIHVGARPLTVPAWRDLLGEAGLVVEEERRAPMRLLSPRRVIDDEGFVHALGILGRVARDSTARHRVLEMRACFNRFRDNIGAVALVARKV